MISNDDKSVLAEIESFKKEATEKTNLSDFGDPVFEEPLAAWINDLKNSAINEFGRDFLRRLAVRDLCKRLNVIACLTENPEILEVEIPPVIFITGAARTGSTLLHNLMATHPLSRPLKRWELMSPVPPPTPETYETDPRIAKLQASMEPLRGSMLENLHWVNANEPDENTWGFFNCTGLLGRGIAPLLPTWGRWIEDNDLKPTYRDFRKLIQILLWKCPPPAGGHLLLKCVMTTMRVHDFAEVFPEASMVITHRDPFRSLVSSCTVGETIYQPFLQEPPGPLHEDGMRGRSTLTTFKLILRALLDLAKAESPRVANVRYADLMRDAVLTAGTVYQDLGLEPPVDFERRVLDYLEDQRSGKRAKPPKKLDSFGYSADSVWNDKVVAEYCEFFGLQREQTRLTDTRSGSEPM
ncbi:MAG: sulfotransferase [Deltaproteobacteria bacterium]|nr:sulfotransferase [Deltaproteobacteria bacterium]